MRTSCIIWMVLLYWDNMIWNKSCRYKGRCVPGGKPYKPINHVCFDLYCMYMMHNRRRGMVEWEKISWALRLVKETIGCHCSKKAYYQCTKVKVCAITTDMLNLDIFPSPSFPWHFDQKTDMFVNPVSTHYYHLSSIIYVWPQLERNLLFIYYIQYYFW